MQADVSMPKSHRRWLYLVLALGPIVLLFGVFYYQLQHGSGDTIPSALIGKTVPEFSLEALGDIASFNKERFSNMLLSDGHVTLLNVFASWCAPCHEEHPMLMALAQTPVFKDSTFHLVGLAYKDTSAHITQFLSESGNPYQQIGLDGDGRVGIDFGVYGVPETFVIAGDGTIIQRFVGPLTPEIITTSLASALTKAQQQTQTPTLPKSHP